MPRKRKTSTPTTREEAILEVVAVLNSNPESTDAEILDSVNAWLKRRSCDLELTLVEIEAKRAELQIPESTRKPFQRGLF